MQLLSNFKLGLQDVIFNSENNLNIIICNKIARNVKEEDRRQIYHDIMYQAIINIGSNKFFKMQLYKQINNVANEIISQYKKGEKNDVA